MRFQQIRELVRWAADYHARFARLYSEKASSGEGGERLRMSLEYLAKHEQQMQSELEQYLAEDSDHRGVLNTWFDDAVDIPHAPVLDRLPKSLNSDTVQTVLATALVAHRTLQDLYAQRVEHAVTGAERELFESLSGRHEGEVRRLVRDMQRLEDY